MFDKEIEFSTHEEYFKTKQDIPIPIKLNIPEWYKKLDHTILNKTIKGCIPFLDTLTSGYLLKIPQDFFIRHNVYNGQLNIKDSFSTFAMNEFSIFNISKKINLNHGNDVHPITQVGGKECPFVDKNKNLPFYKILNPWRIKTPRGYSCLFVPPLNNSDDRFSIISGIVDTDVFPVEINFPIIINGDKYPVLEDTIKKGTPYVQVIPFKRDNWKMSIKPIKESEIKHSIWKYEGFNLLHKYKNLFWKKKLWK
jgi:hypothetical protein